MMLRLSESVTPLIIQRLIIAQVISGGGRKTEALHTLRLRLEVAAARAAVDSFIVGGISFFASFAALGYQTPMINIKLSFFSATTMAGLAFFNELKSQMKQK